MADPEPKIRELFSKALECRTAQEKAAFLDQACQGDAALRARLEELLQAHREAGSFLQEPSAFQAAAVDAPPVQEQPGTVVGPYKLLEPIGEGGMGTVWMAQQTEPVKRLVAVKLIKAGMDSKQVLARFEAERQALALMDHPNIARVLDAGTTGAGRPYFVMDLVKGVPITRYCDEHRLTPRQRLELFVPVCQAIQHAHQKGIIHRDLKPSNVLVAPYDGKPVVKVIDFGVAKATGPQLTDRTLVTGFGAVVGTLEYMSPEQAELNNHDIDTRSDIYALGVLLYELLTGSPPFSRRELEKAGMLEMLRVIREEEPTRPSTKLSTAEGLPSLAANRGMEPAKLTKLVRGELDWVVLKALEKDRDCRYETASAFAADVQRYLADEPVQACPPSLGYRLRKFVRRNRWPVLAASLAVLALVAGVAGTTWGMLRAEQARRDAVAAQAAESERAAGERRAREEAQTRLAQVERGTEILAAVFRDVDPMAADNAGVTLRELLCRRLGEAAQQLEGEALGEPLVVARLQHVLGISLRELGHFDQAQVVLIKACRTRERLLGADDLETVATKHDLALVYREQGKYAPAEALHQEALAVRTARLGADHPDTLISRHHLAILYGNQRKYALAEALFQEVLAARTARLGAEHPDTLTSQHRLALLYRAQGKYALAEALYQEVLAARTARLGPDHLDTVATKGSLAALYLSQGKHAPAAALCKEVLAIRTAKLGADHPDTLTSRYHLAILSHRQGKFALAEALHREVVAVRTAKLGAGHPYTLNNQDELIALYLDQGKYASAEALCKEVLAIRTAKLGADHPDTLTSQYCLSRLYRSMKQLDRSIPLLEETLRLRKAKFGPDDPLSLGEQFDLGIDYCDAGRFADAIVLLEEVHRKGRTDPNLAGVGRALLTAYLRTGKTTEATALAAEQVGVARQQFSADSPWLGVALADTGQALLDGKAYAAAEPLLRESLSLGERLDPDAWDTHHARSLFGGVLLGQQKYAAAESLLRNGYEGLRRTQGGIVREVKDAKLRGALERLIRLYDAWGNPDEAAKWRTELEKANE
jgi:serine/threonine protein kinase/tetratricopeptide (TPR) repeat protein